MKAPNFASQPILFRGIEPRAARRWTLVALSVWLIWAGLDWGMRFWKFRWQDRWLESPPSAAEASSTDAGKEKGNRWRDIATKRGGDLSAFLPVRRVAERYEEVHAGRREPMDEAGRVNPEGCWRTCEGVVAGDSFMLSGGRTNFVGMLESVSGMALYNQGIAGAGAVLPLRQYVESWAFPRRPPMVVWAITARDMDAAMFARQDVSSWFERAEEQETPGAAARNGRRIRWDALGARRLDRDWPNTSVTAWAARKLWERIRLGALGIWPWEVVPMGGDMLGYAYNLQAFSGMDAERDADAVTGTILKVAHGLEARGERLMVVLVPEKEQIYPTALPAEWAGKMEESVKLAELVEKRLKAEGVPAVALHGTFREAAADGRRLYWRDDTHWNEEGIRLGAETVWEAFREEWRP